MIKNINYVVVKSEKAIRVMFLEFRKSENKITIFQLLFVYLKKGINTKVNFF